MPSTEKIFGERLKQLRRAAGYRSQDAFSEAFGVSLDTVRNWEQGKALPRTGEILKLCAFFHCDMDYLFGRIGLKTHRLEDICSYTGLSDKAVKNLLSIGKRTTGFYDLDVASELIASRRFYALTRAILDLKYVQEEVEGSFEYCMNSPDPPGEGFGTYDLMDEVRTLKALRYEVTEAVMEAIDDAGQIDSLIRSVDRYLDAEMERTAERED